LEASELAWRMSPDIIPLHPGCEHFEMGLIQVWSSDVLEEDMYKSKKREQTADAQ
jgi:hypothetical protein